MRPKVTGETIAVDGGRHMRSETPHSGAIGALITDCPGATTPSCQAASGVHLLLLVPGGLYVLRPDPRRDGDPGRQAQLHEIFTAVFVTLLVVPRCSLAHPDLPAQQLLPWLYAFFSPT